MEPATGLAILGGAVGSAKLVEKILGPTAEYLGEGLKDYAQKAHQNLARIFQNAGEKLGDKLEEPGAVPPRVLKGIVDHGLFCEDELSAEYFGGVLASSRSQTGRDDRGATFIAMLGRLSTYQIRTHYIFHYVLKTLCHGRTENMATTEGRYSLRLFVPAPVYNSAMAFQEHEARNVNVLLPHVMNGLFREDLIEDNYCLGTAEAIKETSGMEVDKPGLLFHPSGTGVELWLWAHGRSNILPQDFLSMELSLIEPKGIHVPDGSTCFIKEEGTWIKG